VWAGPITACTPTAEGEEHGSRNRGSGRRLMVCLLGGIYQNRHPQTP
jgi:hypothetical protein